MTESANAPKDGFKNYSEDDLRKKTAHMSPRARRKFGKSLVDNPKTTAKTKENWMKIWNNDPEYFKSKTGAKGTRRSGNSDTVRVTGELRLFKKR